MSEQSDRETSRVLQFVLYPYDNPWVWIPIGIVGFILMVIT